MNAHRAQIVSMSLQTDLLEELGRMQNELSCGRSELLRQGVTLLKEEARSLEKLSGHVDCVLVLMHSNAEKQFSRLLHQNEDLIKTQIHSKFCNDQCLELFVLHGSAQRIKKLYAALKTAKRVAYLKLLVP